MKDSRLTGMFSSILITACAIIVILSGNGCQKEAKLYNGSLLENEKIPPLSTIIYTDVTPDSLKTASHSVKSASYGLDINNDSIKDFSIVLNWNSSQRCGAECQPGSYSLTIATLNNNLVLDNEFGATPLSYNDAINKNSQRWNSGISTIFNRGGNPCCSGLGWVGSIGSSEKYLGLKLTKGVNTLYGWMRVNVTAGFISSFTILDYAYNSDPGKPILAGQTQ